MPYWKIGKLTIFRENRNGRFPFRFLYTMRQSINVYKKTRWKEVRPVDWAVEKQQSIWEREISIFWLVRCPWSKKSHIRPFLIRLWNTSWDLGYFQKDWFYFEHFRLNILEIFCYMTCARWLFWQHPSFKQQLK